MANPIEKWKAEKHPLDVWDDLQHHAQRDSKLSEIDAKDLERIKWYGFLYRKRDKPGRFMNRVRLTGNELSAAQAKEIALMAYEYGHGIVDVTTRANLQIQGLTTKHLPKMIDRMERVGLTSMQTAHDNIRNVFGHPFSGTIPGELIDTRQLCHDVDSIYLASREYSDLPRKLNICFNGTDEHPAHFWTQDISFLATHDADGEVVFQVLLAGTQGQNPHLAWHLPVYVQPEQVVPFTQAILDLFREQGDREKRNKARLRFLVERIGVEGVLDWLEQNLPFRLAPCITEPVPMASAEKFVGFFRQQDPKLWTMGLSVPLGRMTWQQLEGLAILSRRWADGQLRTTMEQGIAVINIPTGFKDAAATAAAALGLSVQADDIELNTVACTGSQFCNIAVTQTKGHMFQLIEKLRKRSLKQHGIRIHMSGCPSSCAQHFTADIGLKGVRVRRLLGTTEGFDVFLGGGIAGQVHMALPFRLGVDVEQLPNLIEEVIGEYHAYHKPGQTFSIYWREKLKAAKATKTAEEEYQLPIWICEQCDHHHEGEDPPVFCPTCAGLRRYFARVEDASSINTIDIENSNTSISKAEPERTDGYTFACNFSDIPKTSGLSVELNGQEYALFRNGKAAHCVTAECPHEGAPLADGDFENGVVTCPWHQWTFNTCSGCSIDPQGNDVQAFATKVEEDQVYILLTSSEKSRTSKPVRVRPETAELQVIDIIQEADDVKTFRLDNAAQVIPFDLPGKFAQVCVNIDSEDVWRSFTISSSPAQPKTLDLTIKLNPSGTVSRYLFEEVQPGDRIKLKGAQGGFYFDPAEHIQPLVLISAGSGITPMMSIARYLHDSKNNLPCTFLYGARTEKDLLFDTELQALVNDRERFIYCPTLSQPEPPWESSTGRLQIQHVEQNVADICGSRYFLCGPNSMMEHFQNELLKRGVPPDQIHTEQFHKASSAAVVNSP